MPVASPMVDKIFARCAIRYGSLWLAKWDGLPIEAVRQDWANVLAAFEAHPRVIEYALVNLPLAFPPNAGEFREICNGAPEELFDRPPALAEPEPDVERFNEVFKRLPVLQAAVKPLDWAYALQEREKNGEQLHHTQKLAWRSALIRADGWATINAGDFNPIPEAALPPAMRQARDEIGRPIPPMGR